MAWHRPSDKSLSEPITVSLLTHVCVTRPQWVNVTSSTRFGLSLMVVNGLCFRCYHLHTLSLHTNMNGLYMNIKMNMPNHFPHRLGWMYCKSKWTRHLEGHPNDQMNAGTCDVCEARKFKCVKRKSIIQWRAIWWEFHSDHTPLLLTRINFDSNMNK